MGNTFPRACQPWGALIVCTLGRLPWVVSASPAYLTPHARMWADEAAVAGWGLVYDPAWQVRDHVIAGRLKVVLRNDEVPALPDQHGVQPYQAVIGQDPHLARFPRERVGRAWFQLRIPCRRTPPGAR